MLDVILGLQWGDEGKGKIVDFLAPQYEIIARFQGGPNAGHTIMFENNKIVLHTIPSGINYENITNIIGNGVVIEPFLFQKEIEKLEQIGLSPSKNLIISRRCNLITPTHRLLDICYENRMREHKIGSTLKGIGPSYTDKIARKGIRIVDIENGSYLNKLHKLENEHIAIIKSLGYDINDFEIDGLPFEEYKSYWLKAIDNLQKFVFEDTEIFLNNKLAKGCKVLAEGAQGTLLDVDFGSYPFVTSSNTTIGGLITGLGIAPKYINKVYGVFKAYCTRVGNGEFPTELTDERGKTLQKAGFEYGSTTGRERRCGWLDLPLLSYSVMLNGVTDLIITKADVLSVFNEFSACEAYSIEGKHYKLPTLKDFKQFEPVFTNFTSWQQDIANCKHYEDLPENLKKYITFIEKYLNVPISIISTGPQRNQTILKN